uniref:NADH-ubiquinone oxidoreductase chain 4 n=1 Tax=Trachinops taeniatus TaxID=1040957 RepID=I1T2H1_9TELE|nr:NADH dehydrogenase subunit 4 [Trachinops taeniatus]AEK53193.1 NADH dehydrogenase subunit 4 [Trachinops taeniatus]
MLKLILPTLSLVPILWSSHPRYFWPDTTILSFLIALGSLAYLTPSSLARASSISLHMKMDHVSAPLVVLTCWLLPMMLLASQNSMATEPLVRRRQYVTLLVILNTLLIMAFSAADFMMFYLMFEATLVPTIIIVTRWGSQEQRLGAGSHLLFYTMVGSLPLLVAFIYLYVTSGSLYFTLAMFKPLVQVYTIAEKMWCISLLFAFLMKLPLYGMHLWLPKAHVEAPIAGSMVLAGILLKLGGYGLIHALVLIRPESSLMHYPFIVLALWGVVMTSSMCIRQTDLKSLIAYSSVSHMGLVTAAILIQSPPSISAGLILMIAHGLTSSTLFVLANTVYEQTHSRMIALCRGLHMILPLLSVWWLLACIINLALPPSLNFIAELVVILNSYYWSHWTIYPLCFGAVVTMSYSLHLYLMTQRSYSIARPSYLFPSQTREHIVLFLHLAPLVLLIFCPDMMT